MKILDNFTRRLNSDQKKIVAIVAPVIVFIVFYPIADAYDGYEYFAKPFAFEHTWLIWLIYLSLTTAIELRLFKSTLQYESNTDENLEPIEEIQIARVRIDEKYEKEREATFVGVMIIVLNILILIFRDTNTEPIIGENNAKYFFALSSLLIRIFITSWVVRIALRQNRNQSAWGFLAFIFPSLALIIIGQLPKLKLFDYPIDSDE